MTVAANQSYLRAINQRSVLRAIYEHGPVSKAQLARMLKISKPAMADNTSLLMQSGIVEELGEPEVAKGSGRKPNLLRIKKNFKYIATLDFSYQSSRFDLFNLKIETISSFSVRQTPQRDFDAWSNMCKSALETLLSAQGLQPEDLAAIGISSPGVISLDQEHIINGPMYGAFNPQALYKKLQSEFNCPVFIYNSTNASAQGECEYGAGKDAKNLVYISCGQGLGAGIIIDRKLYRGGQMAAGEIANFITPQDLDSPLSLEKRICIDGLLEKYIEHNPASAEESPDELFEKITGLWQNNDPFVRQCIDGIAVELGCVICNLVMALNCDVVVLGGEYLVFAPQILPVIDEMIRKYCIVPAKLVPAELAGRASNTGIAAICREMYFDELCELPQ
ncbi:ROK family transcriptional regulator [Breznakiella homolactica]|uniref:ROK family transcriptional regulator n=1 Tax=Breznakiella homolactica TaxID=2798577 RepID=A0A7T7XN39_9SPIR|nr:ROK family transcriptional regulator [Breznakiella homolactica]QQO09297.1 ROK family transcriptional regulator [Breznakiella homolactica]